jgi:hypothetical protein
VLSDMGLCVGGASGAGGGDRPTFRDLEGALCKRETLLRFLRRLHDLGGFTVGEVPQWAASADSVKRLYAARGAGRKAAAGAAGAAGAAPVAGAVAVAVAGDGGGPGGKEDPLPSLNMAGVLARVRANLGLGLGGEPLHPAAPASVADADGGGAAPAGRKPAGGTKRGPSGVVVDTGKTRYMKVGRTAPGGPGVKGLQPVSEPWNPEGVQGQREGEGEGEGEGEELGQAAGATWEVPAGCMVVLIEASGAGPCCCPVLVSLFSCVPFPPPTLRDWQGPPFPPRNVWFV